MRRQLQYFLKGKQDEEVKKYQKGKFKMYKFVDGGTPIVWMAGK